MSPKFLNVLLDFNCRFFDLKSFGKSIVMVTHNKDYAKYGDSSIELSDGKIINQTGYTASRLHENKAV